MNSRKGLYIRHGFHKEFASVISRSKATYQEDQEKRIDPLSCLAAIGGRRAEDKKG